MRGISGKRAQVTLFIIIALVLIAGAIFYLYYDRQKNRPDSTEELKRAAEVIARSDSVRLYVESCLEQVSEEAVMLVGRQGGYIYDYQMEKGVFFLAPGGKRCDILPPGLCDLGRNIIPVQTDSNPDRLDNVSFLIKANPNLNFPFYPYDGNLRTRDQPDTFGTAVGGESKGSPLELCDLYGPNARDTEGAEHTCFNSYSSLGRSIQNFMQDYISEKVMECTDFSSIAVTQGSKIEAENATAEVILGETDILVKLRYKLKITLPSRQSTATITDYSYHMRDIRLKNVYELVYNLVREETTNIFFDKTSLTSLYGLDRCMSPESQALRIPCYKEEMNLTVIENPCADCGKNRYADIIQIRDNHLILDGEPFIFQFAVANRPPALEYIDLEIPDTTHYYNYLEGISPSKTGIYHKRTMADGSDDEYDIVIGKGDTLEIYPYGIDPDENSLAFGYEPRLEDSETSQKLEASALFQTTKRDVEIGASSLGIGPHYVRLTVSDGEELSDWQDLKIMVCETEWPDPLQPEPEYYCT